MLILENLQRISDGMGGRTKASHTEDPVVDWKGLGQIMFRSFDFVAWFYQASYIPFISLNPHVNSLKLKNNFK
jgi:hypothetical protein